MFELTQKYLKEILEYSPDTGEFIRLKKSGDAKIGDIAGHKATFTQGKKYIQISIKNKQYLAHRLAWLYMVGDWPKNQIDHEDGNGLHNWWDNLSEATRSQNAKNQRLPKNNTSGHIGVYWVKKEEKWKAAIRVDTKTIGLGYFTEIKDAIAARKAGEKKYGFHKNHGQDRPL